jgi:hypothetical protein
LAEVSKIAVYNSIAACDGELSIISSDELRLLVKLLIMGRLISWSEESFFDPPPPPEQVPDSVKICVFDAVAAVERSQLQLSTNEEQYRFLIEVQAGVVATALQNYVLPQANRRRISIEELEISARVTATFQNELASISSDVNRKAAYHAFLRHLVASVPSLCTSESAPTKPRCGRGREANTELHHQITDMVHELALTRWECNWQDTLKSNSNRILAICRALDARKVVHPKKWPGNWEATFRIHPRRAYDAIAYSLEAGEKYPRNSSASH